MSTNPKRILVAYGSKRGGTAEIAKAIADAIRGEDIEVDCLPVGDVGEIELYDAVVIGGALYAHRWMREAKRFTLRHAAALRARPVWMFSSGPLDDSAGKTTIPVVPTVAKLMARVGARGHVTFGGRLTPDAKGFPASAMAKTHAGDWRDWERIGEWSREVAGAIATAPQPVPMPSSKPARWLLVALCSLVGITAIGGGIALVASPDGSYVSMPTSQLAHSPFSTFLIPGLVLLVVIGLGNLAAAVAVRRNTRHSNTLALGAGLALLGWIVTEMVMLQTINLLQTVYFVTALIVIAEALRRRHRAFAMRGLAIVG